MATSLSNFPLAVVTDGITSYVQHLFASNRYTPSDYRWNSNERESRIRISGPFVYNSEKPSSTPYIVIERTSFSLQNGIIDDVRGAKENVFTDEEKVSVADGAINITIGSQAATEASNIANYLLVQFQADRHGIMNTLGFVRNMKVMNISNEKPVMKASEVSMWEVSMVISVSIQLGWINKEKDGDIFKKCSVRAIDKTSLINSTKGLTYSGSDVLSDSSANFGYNTDNSPQLLRSEMDNGWYYVRMIETGFLYNVKEIVDSTSLRLENLDGSPFSPKDTLTGVEYNLEWNDVHLHVEIPRR